MATPPEDPERHDTLDHGLKISCIREFVEYLPSSLSPHWSVQDKDLVFEDAVKDFNLVFSAVKTGRSLAASYSLQNDIQCRYPMDPPAVSSLSDGLQCSFRFNRTKKPNYSNLKQPRLLH